MPREQSNTHVAIRAEEPGDVARVRALNECAFESPAEARLVETLREQASPTVSIVAERRGAIVGHIMLSPVALSTRPELKLMGLAPMAVAAEHRRQGIGSALVRAGLERCSDLGYGAVVVLGHPDYYPRFGFAPALQFGLECDYDAPPEAFMAIELRSGYLKGASGKVEYHSAFDDL